LPRHPSRDVATFSEISFEKQYNYNFASKLL